MLDIYKLYPFRMSIGRGRRLVRTDQREAQWLPPTSTIAAAGADAGLTSPVSTAIANEAASTSRNCPWKRPIERSTPMIYMNGDMNGDMHGGYERIAYNPWLYLKSCSQNVALCQSDLNLQSLLIVGA